MMVYKQLLHGQFSFSHYSLLLLFCSLGDSLTRCLHVGVMLPADGETAFGGVASGCSAAC
jgi:hypothetical protein